MAKAVPIFYRKRYIDDGAIAELQLWKVPAPVRGSIHSFKYSLFYGYPGVRVIGYDNEAGKGDHRHVGSVEFAYHFTGPESLIRDFEADVELVRRKNEGDLQQ